MADKLFLMPLDWEALLTDEKVIAMTDSGFRAYMHLLRAAWQSDIPASLPDNDSFLARVSGLGLEAWKQVRPEIVACFRVVNGRWHQKKMRQVYDDVVQRRKSQQERTKAASEARWRPPHDIRNGERDGHRNGATTESVTDSNQRQNEREKDIQTERHPDPLSSSSPPASSDGPGLPGIEVGAAPIRNEPIPFTTVVELYNTLCPSMPRARLNDDRKKSIRARWLQCQKTGEDGLAWFNHLFTKAEASDFLSGRKTAPNSRWRCGLDWLLGPTNAPKVIEGNYENRPGVDLSTPGASWR